MLIEWMNWGLLLLLDIQAKLGQVNLLMMVSWISDTALETQGPKLEPWRSYSKTSVADPEVGGGGGAVLSQHDQNGRNIGICHSEFSRV